MRHALPSLLALACTAPQPAGPEKDDVGETDASRTDDTAPDPDTAGTDSTSDDTDPQAPGRSTSCGTLTAPFTACAVALSPAQATLPANLMVPPHVDALVADLDEDGWLDVCASRFPGPLTCQLDRGGLTFDRPPTTLGTGASFGAVSSDFDGDGHVDVAFLDVPVPEDGDLTALDVRLRVLRGAGDGTFTDVSEAAGFGLLPAPSCDDRTPVGLSVLHLDGDGRLDLVVRMAGTCKPYVYKGKPGMRWERSISTLTDPVETGLLTVDFDLDGHLDLLAYSFGTPASTYFHGKQGVFTAAPFAPPFNGVKTSSPMGCGAGDVDGDGDLDVYCSDHGHQTLLRRDADGQVFDITAASGAAVATTVGGDTPIGWSSWLIDLDGRNGPDLLSPAAFEADTETWDQQLLLLLQDGDGRFLRLLTGPTGAAAQERGLVVADFDGNRCPDLLLLPADREAPFAPLRLLLGHGCSHPWGGVAVRGHNGQEAVGATVRVRWADDRLDAYRVTKTGGYAGVGPALIWPAPRVEGTAPAAITVHWTDGTESSHTVAELEAGLLVQPAGSAP